MAWRKPSEMEALKTLKEANMMVEILKTESKPLSDRSQVDLQIKINGLFTWTAERWIKI